MSTSGDSRARVGDRLEKLSRGLEAESEARCLTAVQVQAVMLGAALAVIAGLLDEDPDIRASAILLAHRWEIEGGSLGS